MAFSPMISKCVTGLVMVYLLGRRGTAEGAQPDRLRSMAVRMSAFSAATGILSEVWKLTVPVEVLIDGWDLRKASSAEPLYGKKETPCFQYPNPTRPGFRP